MDGRVVVYGVEVSLFWNPVKVSIPSELKNHLTSIHQLLTLKI